MTEGGSSSPKPSPRLLSQKFMRGRDGMPSARNRTTLLPFFGEFLAFDILQGTENACPIEVMKIAIEQCDATFDRDCLGRQSMPVLRTRYDRNTGQSPNSPRAQLNLMSSWIDASTVYSTKEVWLSAMRSYTNGTLNIDPSTNLPPFNKIGAPISNPPPNHINKVLDPGRLFCKFLHNYPSLLSRFIFDYFPYLFL